MIRAVGKIAGISFWLASIAYLANDLTSFIAFVFFIFFFYIPLSIISIKIFDRLDFPVHLSSICGFIAAFLLLIPLYVIRKWLAIPTFYIDFVCCILLSCWAYRFLRFSERARFSETFPLLFWVIQLLIIPLRACLNWAGFEIHFQDKVYYLGQHLVDSGTLSGVVSTIAASPFVPLYPVTGLGGLNYHWLFFTIPAFISDFMGGSIKHATSMALSNLLMGHLLFLTLYKVAGIYLDAGEKNRHIQSWAATLILFSAYFLTVLLVLGYRMPLGNHLLMTLPYSINYFGNNTFAIACIILAIMLIFEWNRTSRKIFAFFGAFFFSLTVSFSATLTFSCFLGIFLLLIFGLINKPLKATAIGLTVAVLCFIFFKFLGLFDGGHANRLCIDFDNGKFIQNILVGFFPAFFIAYYGVRQIPGMNAFLLFIVGGLIVPTLFMFKNSSYGRIDFSMKTSSLIVGLITPLFAKGLEFLYVKRRIGLILFSFILVLLGTIMPVLLAPTFVFARNSIYETGTTRICKSFVIEQNYFSVLDYLRYASLPSSVVIDPFFEEQQETRLSLMISQRRQFLPTMKDSFAGKISEEVHNRRNIWKKWELSSFQDSQLSLYFAQNGDYLVLNKDIKDSNWNIVFQKGEYRVFKSRFSKN